MNLRKLLGLILILGAMAMLVACDPANRAGALRWGGSLETDVSFSEFYGGDHTVALWFMAQYENAYQGPIFTNTSSGLYLIGMGDFNNTGQAHLEVDIGGNRSVYILPDPTPLWTTWATVPPSTQGPVAQWRHVALVKRGGLYAVYLDGVKQTNTRGLSDVPIGGSAPTGMVRFGQRAVAPNQRPNQFYGFVDNIGIFNRALTASEIQALVNDSQFPGIESDLLVGWNFEPIPQGITPPPALTRPITPVGDAYITAVSAMRSDIEDAARLPEPANPQVMELPFAPGDIWVVGQPFNVPTGSHKGYAAFCWDFIYVPPSAPRGQPYTSNAASNGRPFTATAAGSVIDVKNDGRCGTNQPNYIMVQNAPGLVGNYLHQKAGSQAVSVGSTVAAGQMLAQTGDVGAACGGYHLHLAFANVGEAQVGMMATYPVAFSDYFVSNDYGLTWFQMPRGVPTVGQWIRRAN